MLFKYLPLRFLTQFNHYVSDMFIKWHRNTLFSTVLLMNLRLRICLCCFLCTCIRVEGLHKVGAAGGTSVLNQSTQ